MFSTTKKLAQQTAQKMLAGHFSLTAWWALKHAGIFDAILNLEAQGQGLVPLVHAARTNMAPDILQALIDYLAAAGLLTLKDDQARLTPDARALLEHEDAVLELVHAYQPTLAMAEHMLARLKTPAAGSPLHRKSEALAASQAKRYAAELFPAVLAILQKHRFSHVLDLSCATGELLMYLAENSTHIVGVGIAPDGPSVRRANEAITQRSLEKRLIAVPANPVDICTDTQRAFDRVGISRKLWEEIDIIIAPSLFSEIAARETTTPPASPASPNTPPQTLARTLASIPKKFPHAHLLIIEPTASPRLEKNYFAPELTLLLRLSKSTPLTEEKWRDLITAAHLRILHETPLTTDALTLFLCKP